MFTFQSVEASYAQRCTDLTGSRAMTSAQYSVAFGLSGDLNYPLTFYVLLAGSTNLFLHTFHAML